VNLRRQRSGDCTYHRVLGGSFETVGCFDLQRRCVHLVLVEKSVPEVNQDEVQAYPISQSLERVGLESERGPDERRWYVVLGQIYF
jgi:hypothetical protein